MDISVALDGGKERNLIFGAGDQATINLKVYAHDGDSTPIVVTELRWSTGGQALFPVGSQFTVPCVGRTPYRIVGKVAGVLTTLVYGVIEVPCACNVAWDCCCIFPKTIITAMATNVTVSDAASYFNADNVEDVLQIIGQRLKAAGI